MALDHHGRSVRDEIKIASLQVDQPSTGTLHQRVVIVQRPTSRPMCMGNMVQGQHQHPVAMTLRDPRTHCTVRAILRVIAHGRNWPRVLLALVLSIQAIHTQAQARSVALLIGNADYQHERKLRNPVNDAELLGRVLKQELGFDLVRVERNLPLSRMDAVIEQFARDAVGASTVVFYFSGHGLTNPADRRSYLLPVDARTGARDTMPLRRQAVSALEVREQLATSGANVTLLLLDACRDGPGDGRSGSKGLARVGGGNGLLVAYATEEGQIADDGSGMVGPYAQALAEAWRLRQLPVLAQLDKVYDLVTARLPGQRPTREGNLRADAYLVAPSRMMTANDSQFIEAEAWGLCRSAANAIPCDDYLATWPQGRFAALARTRQRELRAASEPRPVETRCAGCPDMVVVPAGEFAMGRPPTEIGRSDNEIPQRRVAIARFEIGRTEVTQAQWKALMGTNPSRFQQCGDDCPVDNVSWNDVQQFLRRLNEQTGRHYRLPTEAEWEYAARAGTSTPFSTGQTITSDQANFDGNYTYNNSPTGTNRERTVRVGSFAPNGFGVHDMHGNVGEWVQDVWHDNYLGAPVDGSEWSSGGDQARRVVRGGSWLGIPQGLRSASRGRGTPDDRNDFTGFRVARSL